MDGPMLAAQWSMLGAWALSAVLAFAWLRDVRGAVFILLAVLAGVAGYALGWDSAALQACIPWAARP